jgi:hypothetical protein
VERFTHLGRIIDPRIPSNLFAIVATLVAAGVAFLVGGTSPEPEWGGPMAVGLATFLSWALGRELDPDRLITANIAAVAGGFVAFGHPSAAPGALYLLLVAARILVRTTGRSPLWTDLAVNLAIAAWLAQSAAGWMAGMALAYAVARDAGLRDPAPSSRLWWGGATAVLVTAVASLAGALGGWEPPSTAVSALAAAGVLGAAFLIGPDEPASMADLTAAPLDGRRLQESRIIVLAAAALTALIAGDEGMRALAPVWALLVVGGGVRLTTHRRPASP